jgi:uncharacterized protein (TIGR03437 family)
MFCSLSGQAQVNILTANGNNDRTNANLQESALSPATVNSTTFGKLGSFPVDGQVYAQPLYVSGLQFSGSVRNVVYVTTMHNSVYAFDADATSSNAMLWQVNLGNPVPASLLFGQFGDVGVEVGILGTGAIDLQRSVLYVVADVLEHGAPVFYLHALDLATGAERFNGPVALTASVPGTGSQSLADGTLPFDPMQNIQRPGLLLANDSVYVAFGSHGDQYPFHGWIFSYSASDLSRQPGVYNTTPNGNGGSIWQSGRGLAADLEGNLYIVTGNGDYDGMQNFGESFVKVSADVSSTLDWYTPSDWQSMSNNDFDLSGPALIAGTHVLIGSDKLGNLYAMNGDAMRQEGGTAVISASGGSVFNFAVWSLGGNATVYTQGAQDPLKAFQVTANGVDPKPISIAANSVPFSRVGMTLSANGGQQDSGILWECTGNYNDGTPGTLHAYDASDLTKEVWNSDMNPGRDQMPPVTKFVSPTVANGKVYVPGGSNLVTVYGLFSASGGEAATPAITTIANAASYAQNAISPGEVVAIFGSSLGPSTPVQFDASRALPTMLADTRVLFDGVASPLIFSSAGQIDAVVPASATADQIEVQVQYQGQTSASFPIAVAPATVGIFSVDCSGTGQANVQNQDGSPNSPDNPAAPGSMVTLWATGAGQPSPSGIYPPAGTSVTSVSLPRAAPPVRAQIGGQPAEVLYAGTAPGLVDGVIQVNLRVPAASQTGAAVPVVLHVGNSTSQTGLTLAIEIQ